MNFKVFLFLSWCFFSHVCVSFETYGQYRSPDADFTVPLNIPLFLSGNYGEIRSAHFHAGIDIKTDQVAGKKVFAAEDGYVARINIQSGGYGNSIYIAHPGGYMTVYAHLQEFMPELESYVKEHQYERKSFEVNLFPEPNRFVYKKGEMIGLSGNSGNSSGPHLHFEVRDLKTSIPLNVLNFNFPIADDISPQILWLAVYPLGKFSTVNGEREKGMFQVYKQNATYMIHEEVIKVSGEIGFGIETYDFLNGSANRCSPYNTIFTIDDQIICHYRLDSISFSMTSYVNSHIDYGEKIRSGRVIQKLFVDPNNKLKIYKVLSNRGLYLFNDTLLHRAKICVSDVYGNESIFIFSLQSVAPVDSLIAAPKDSTAVSTFHYDQLNVYENNDIRVVVPKDALYDNILFQYGKIPGNYGGLSDTFTIHNEYTPLHKPYILSVRMKDLPDKYRDKIMIAAKNGNGKMISYGGEYKNGFVTAQMGNFGRFYLVIDTISPSVIPVNFRKDGHYTEGQTLSFTIQDHESGISNYKGYIDGKWALFKYDAKNDLLIYNIDEKRLTDSKNHRIELIVTDNKDNVAHFRSSFYY